jgi:hypothetical protein
VQGSDAFAHLFAEPVLEAPTLTLALDELDELD